jgi:hypothetical protein
MSTLSLALFCKSYRTDLKRTLRLAKSVEQFNADQIPFYVSVPASDVDLFTEYLAGTTARIISDDLIIQSNPKHDLQTIKALHGGTSQQIVKSEFWRLGYSDVYLCVDSDSMFIRSFRASDFFADAQTPYTVIDEGHELLDTAIATGKKDILTNFYKEARQMQQIFGRTGRCFSYGPNPPIWQRAVWESLDREFLTPKGMSFYDATMLAPVDLNWYGEALLKYQAIRLIPCQPVFKVYHYAWQLDRDLKAKIGTQDWAQVYCGVIYQSAWDREMDWPAEPGSWSSKLARRLRRRLGRM